MLVSPAPFPIAHPNVSYWLDEALKVCAVAIGTTWTLWNFFKSRTYALKPDLQIAGDVFLDSGDLYIDITATLKNLGAGKHIVERAGTSCELVAVNSDLSKQSLRLFEVFPLHNMVEPGESISDHLVWRVENPRPDIIWLRIDLRVVSDRVEWNRTAIVRFPKAISDRNIS